jgi:hypothetical protein
MRARAASFLSFPLSLVLLAAGPAAATQIPLVLDPARSSVTVEDLFSGTPLFGPIALSGTLVVDFAQVPIPAFTTFQMIDLDAAGAGGVSIELDPLASDPGSGLAGVSGGQGVLLFQTPLALDVNVPGWIQSTIGIPPPTVGFVPEPGNTAIAVMVFDLDFQLSGTENLHIVLTAVPEPGGAALVALAALSLGARAAARRRRGRGRARRSPPSGA